MAQPANGSDERLHDRDAEVEKVLAELGPFQPPPGFTHGAEFDPPPPRPIPAILKRGSYERIRRQRACTLLVLGGFLIAMANAGIVRELSYYILALGYIQWIGLALVCIVCAGTLVHLRHRGNFRFVRLGVPAIGRVLRIERFVGGTKHLVQFGYAMLVEHRDHETGEMRRRWIRSDLLDAAAKADRYSLRISPGDYVTLVGLPGRFEGTSRLHGFLGLRPDLEFIQKDGEPRRAPSTWTVIAAVVGFVGIFVLLVGFLYAVDFLSPIGDASPIGIGAGIGAAAGLAGGILLRRRASRKAKGRAGRVPAWVAWLGCLILGTGGGGLCVAALNSGLDRSLSAFRDVEVVQFWQETWYPVFVRRYQIEYRGLDGGEARKYPARVEEMETFGEKLGTIEVGGGALGMEWVRGIHPLVLEPLDAGEPEEKALFVAEKRTADGKVEKVPLKAVIRLRGKERAEASAALVERLVRKIEKR